MSISFFRKFLVNSNSYAIIMPQVRNVGLKSQYNHINHLDEKLSDNQIEALVREHFDLRPIGMERMLNLLQPIYRNTAAYGHFGRDDVELPWEKLDKVELLKQ